MFLFDRYSLLLQQFYLILSPTLLVMRFFSLKKCFIICIYLHQSSFLGHNSNLHIFFLFFLIDILYYCNSPVCSWVPLALSWLVRNKRLKCITGTSQWIREFLSTKQPKCINKCICEYNSPLPFTITAFCI